MAASCQSFPEDFKIVLLLADITSGACLKQVFFGLMVIFGPSVFYLFSPSVLWFSINSALRIRPNGPVQFSELSQIEVSHFSCLCMFCFYPDIPRFFRFKIQNMERKFQRFKIYFLRNEKCLLICVSGLK